MAEVTRRLVRELCLPRQPFLLGTPAVRPALVRRRERPAWLAGRPILAKPAGAITRAAKWAKRNKLVSGSLVLAMLAMTVGTGINLWHAREARYQEGQAEAGADALAQQTTKLNSQLTESERRLDLSRLREAEGDFERNAVQAAIDRLNQIAPENRCIAWGLLRRRVDGADMILWHTGLVTSVAFSPDGRRLVTGSLDRTARVWDAATGHQVDEPIPEVAHGKTVLPDGRLVIPQSTRVRVVDSRLPPDELAWRRWLARPQPDRHTKFAEGYEADPFAAAVQRSLEQHARGQLAAEDLDFDRAQKHFLSARLLKPYQWPELAPLPRRVK